MADPAPRRGAGNHDRNVRSSQEGGQPMGSERQPPPRRVGAREPAGRERVGGGRGTDGSGKGRGNNKPISDEGLYGSSHIPTFGNWDTAGGADPNFTVMFTKASNEKRGDPAADLKTAKGSGGAGTGDSYGNSNAHPKKQSSSWWCFG